MQNRINKTIKILFSMFFLSIGCKLLGFLRQMFLAKYFGTGNVVDAYVLAQSIPNILFGGILVSFGASYMPLLSKRYEKDGLQAANEYTSRILTILFSLSVLVTLVGVFFSDQITQIMAAGLNDEAKSLTSQFVKYTFGYTFFAASAGIYSNYLQYKGVFSRQIIGDYIQNLFFISFIWIAHMWGNNLLILGLFFGYLFRVLYLRLLANRHGYRLVLKTDKLWDDLKEVKSYAIPVFLSTTANEINAYVDRTLASRLDSGSISALNYAHQLSTVFMELTITILATVIFPKLVQTFTRNEEATYKSYVKRGLLLCGMISIPLAMGSIVFSRQIIELIFQRGAFVSSSTIRTSDAFLFYSIGVFSLAICTYMGKVYYSAGDMKTPMICAAIGVAINIIGDLLLVGIMRERGLALATSLASIVNSILLVFLHKKRRFHLFGKDEVSEIAKMFFSSVVSIGIGFALFQLFSGSTATMKKLGFIGICFLSALMYVFFLHIFKVKELKKVLRNGKE